MIQRQLWPKKTVFSDLYDLEEELGRGAYGVVFKVTDKTTHEKFAVKIVEAKTISKKDYENLKKEAKICKHLDHPNIVRLHRVIDERNRFYFVFDLVTGGELFKDIVKQGYYTEELAAKCMWQLLDGVRYCHKMGIVHRDLKPENILIVSKKNKAIKISDFGLAVKVSGDKLKWLGYAGSPHYASPEMLSYKPYGKSTDMWSCGVIMFILLSGHFPFNHRKNEELGKMIIKGDYHMKGTIWNDVTEEGKDLMSKQLCVEPLRRITAEQALQHPWFKKVREAPKIHRQETFERLKEFNEEMELGMTSKLIRLTKNIFLQPTLNFVMLSEKQEQIPHISLLP